MLTRILQTFAAFCPALLIIVVLAGVATACPTCKDGLAGNDLATQKMAEGYFYSILFMMSMPFMILGTFGSIAYFSIRKAQSQPAAKLEESR